MSKRMPAMRFGKRSSSSPSIFDLYDERIQTSPYSNNPVFKKREVPPSLYGLVHKRRPFSNVPENSEWFDNSEDGGENNEVYFCFIYFIT